MITKEAGQVETVPPDRTTNDEIPAVNQSTVPPISEVKIKAADTDERIERLEKVNLALAAALHDQRNLLSVIINNAELLRESMNERAVESEIYTITEEIIHAAYECARISEDGLTLNRNPHGVITLKLTPLDLKKTIEELVKNYRKDVRIHCPGKSPTILADRTYLERLIMNLISNAQKHSRSMEATEIWIEENQDEIRISVKDHGMGLSSQMTDIFKEPHHQNTHETAGYGLGLRICKMICDSHNWCIQGKNNNGEPGAQFIVHISKNSKKTNPAQE